MAVISLILSPIGALTQTRFLFVANPNQNKTHYNHQNPFSSLKGGECGLVWNDALLYVSELLDVKRGRGEGGRRGREEEPATDTDSQTQTQKGPAATTGRKEEGREGREEDRKGGRASHSQPQPATVSRPIYALKPEPWCDSVSHPIYTASWQLGFLVLGQPCSYHSTYLTVQHHKLGIFVKSDKKGTL